MRTHTAELQEHGVDQWQHVCDGIELNFGACNEKEGKCNFKYPQKGLKITVAYTNV